MKLLLLKNKELIRKRRILILDASINDYEYISINLHNANAGNKEINGLSIMLVLLENFGTTQRTVNLKQLN